MVKYIFGWLVSCILLTLGIVFVTYHFQLPQELGEIASFIIGMFNGYFWIYLFLRP